AVAVAHGHRDRVHAGPEPDEPLVDHALVGAQGFLKGADANHLIAHELAHRQRIAAEGDLDVVLGDELVAVAPEAQGMVRERQRKHGEGGVGRGSAEIPNRRDEGQRRVGDGGTAEVYRADHPKRGACAFKVLRQGLQGDPTAVKRFLREAGYGSRVQHPGVVRTYDYGEAEGCYYLALEWAVGQSLTDYVHRVGRLAPAQVEALVRQLADSLGAL